MTPSPSPDANRSPQEVIREALARIEANEAELRAWVSLSDATDTQRPAPQAILAGVGFGVKDVLDTEDLPTERGSPIFAGRRPALDATVVARLRAHGATLVGKTVCTVFGMRDPGPTTNPHDATRTPGGSSSGSAAAVAAGHVELAVGTQTGGSIIRPAAYCGVWGFKPTLGAVDRYGLMLHSSSVDTIGFIGANPEILARAMVAATSGAARDVERSLASISPVEPVERIRFMRSRRDAVLETEARDAIDRWLRDVRSRTGVTVEFVNTPFDDVAIDDQLRTIVDHEASYLLDEFVLEHGDSVGPHVLQLVDRGRRVSATEYRTALHRVAEAADALDRWLGDSCVIAPSTRGVAPRGLNNTGSAEFCRLWSVTGCPAVNVPGLTGESGMPLGVQVVAGRGRDLQVLAFAAAVGRLMPGPDGRDRT